VSTVDGLDDSRTLDLSEWNAPLQHDH
jgi:hypothetical protein